MNFHAEELSAEDENSVEIKSVGSCFPNLMRYKDKYIFDMDEINSYMQTIDKSINRHKGVITRCFKHTKGYILFMVRMNTGKFTNRYIAVGTSGIKKLGGQTVELIDIRKEK